MSAVAPRVSAKFKPYPAYRDSGVEWLGQVPEHWEVKPAKAVFRERRELSSSSDIHLTPSQAYGVLPQSEYIQLTGGSVVLNLEGADNMKHVEPGDFIIHLRSFQGGIEFSPLSGKVSMAYTVLRPSRHIETGFFKWLLKSQIYIQALRRTTDQMRDGQSIKFSQFALNALPVPALTEQQAIAALLDRETAKIDALIEKKRRLIELLKEKRAALISHAVTKGLDPSAPMKDSGIPWLGKVPAHWGVKRLKQVGRIQYGLGQPPEEDDEGVPFIRATDISAGTIDMAGTMRVRLTADARSQGAVLRGGEILVVRSGAYTGDSSLVPTDAAGSLAGYDMFVRVHRAEPEFVAWQLLSSTVLDSQIMLLRMRAAQPHLNREELGDVLVTAPPRAEQREIAGMLADGAQRLHSLGERILDQIERLHEYRSALISAAVTGKIDVREPNARVGTPRHDFVPSTDLGSPRGAE